MSELDQAKFDSFVDRLVREALSSSEHSSFSELLHLLPGIPPPDTIASLNRLRASFPAAAPLIQDAGQCASDSIGQSPSERALGIPHPLDYDWRFDPQTAESLFRTSVELSGAARSAIMIGTPTVAIAALAGTELKQVLLLDANCCAVHHLAGFSPKIKALCIDLLRHPLPALSAGVVIMDPPWYAESISAFLWAASQLCKTGGFVAACFPSVGTRPGIIEERKSLIARAAKSGLKYLKIKPGALKYETPPFERSAFRACGIRNLPSDWRRGDLLLFRRSTARAASHPTSTSPGDEWVDIVIQGIRLKVRAPLGLEFNDPRLRSIIRGDVLPSVSRRDPRRRHADIWTPRNRIFLCSGRSVFVQIARAIASGEQPQSAVARWLERDLTNAEQVTVKEATEQLCSLVHRERAELLDQ
jgi:hypothetical protein